jgi:micrococcal nuclease
MKRILAGFLVGILSTGILAASADIQIASGNIVSIHDGDTINVNLPGLIDVFGKNIGIRIRGIDTPEINSTCTVSAPANATVAQKTASIVTQLEMRKAEKTLAFLARDELRAMLASAETIVLVNPQRDKYFRILATLTVDDVDVAEVLVNQGFADIYDGGTKKGWCGR